MRVNTEESIRLGERIYRRFGSWEAAREASRLHDGVYLVPAADHRQDDKKDDAAAA